MPRYGTPNVSLYLRNLPESTRPDELRGIFSKYGQIRDVYVPSDYYTGRIRGFAYVEYEDIRDAEDAVYSLRGGIHLHGRDIDVEFAVGDRKTPGQMRNKYGGPTYRSHKRSPSPRRRHRSRSHSRSRRSRRSRSRSRSRHRSGSRHRSSRHKKRRSHSGQSHSRSRSRSRDDKRRRSRAHSKSRSRSATPGSVNGNERAPSATHDDINLEQEEFVFTKRESSNAPSD